MESNGKGLVRVSNVKEFLALTSSVPHYEVGISFNGEYKINRKMSVITDRQVPIATPEETVSSYLKVKEIRELTKDEVEGVNQVRHRLRTIYNGIFKGSRFLFCYTLSMLMVTGINCAFDNFLGIFTSIASILLVLGPKRLLKEIRKIVTEKKRIEEIEEYLRNYNLSGLYNIVPNNKDVTMYMKTK